MKKQFAFNIVLLVFLNILIKPFWVFGIDRTVQNIVGSEAYGLYFALFNFSVLFNAFLDLGITNFNNRSIAQSPHLVGTQFPRLILLKLLLGFVYLIICIAAALILGYSSVAFRLLAILSLNQFLASFLLFLRSNISGLQMFITDSIISVTDRFLLIVLCSILLWTNLFDVRVDIWIFALLQTLAYALTCVVALIILFKKFRFEFRRSSFYSPDLIRKSLPFALLTFLMVIYNRSDAVIIERLLSDGARAAGAYAQSYRIFDAVNMISVLFASLLLPMFARLISEKKDVGGLVKISFSLLSSGTIILAVSLCYFAKSFLNALYYEPHEGSVSVFILLMISTIPVSLSYIFGTLLTADGRLYALNVIAGAALVLNVSLNLILIPEFNIQGAAFSALFSLLFVATSQIMLCKKYFSLSFSFRRIAPYFILILLAFLMAFLFDFLHVHFFIKIGLTLVGAIVSSVLLKIIDFQEFYSLIRPESAK